MAIETVEQFYKRIIERVADDIDALPKAMSAAWFDNPTTKRPTIFQVQEIHPFDPFSRIIAIFQDADTIRVYTLPAAPPEPKPADWQPRQPTRYTLSRTAPTYVAEIFPLEAAAEAIADEWNAIAGPDTAEDELEAVIDFLREQGPMLDRDKVIAQLEAGEHQDAGDDDEGEGDDKPAAPALKVVQPS